MSKRDFRYLALSHMWGDPNAEHLKLLTSNIADFEKAIPWNGLSSVYKEAIRVTLALGYKYLWIDSLCIIQNKSHPDWESEARLMATVYGNADCNLAFLFPSFSSDQQETTYRSDPRDWNPCILREATSSHPGISLHHSAIVHKRNEAKHWLVQRDWPLFSRAWTFQEYLLAPRTLLLGHRNLMFHCSRHFYDELLGPVSEAATVVADGSVYRGRALGKWRYFPADLTKGWDKQVDVSSLSALQFMTDWTACVTEFRARELSFAKDRVVAFAGVVRAYANMGCLTYLAGCWAEYFSLTLMWCVDRKVQGPPSYVQVKSRSVPPPAVVCEKVVHQAPSWSPFSVPIYLHHRTNFLFNEDEVNARLRFEQWLPDPPVHWHDIHWSYLDSFCFPGQPKDEVPDHGFDKFEGLTVTLNMPVLPVETSCLKLIEKQLEVIRARNPLDANITWTTQFRYLPDDPALPPSLPKQSVLALVSEFQLCRAPSTNNVERRLAGLVIREVRRGAWRRVGAWKARVVVTDMEIDERIVRHVAKRWRKYHLRDGGNEGGWRTERIALV
jgi:hypothetical protein